MLNQNDKYLVSIATRLQMQPTQVNTYMVLIDLCVGVIIARIHDCGRSTKSPMRQAEAWVATRP